jgi:ABC-type antimicrobial peptide transport system permease subunit
VESVVHDLRHSLRFFRRTPGFTIAAVAALTLGIGTNVAIFTVVNAVLLKPIPFPDPNRLVMLIGTAPQGTYAAGSPAKFLHWRQQTDVLQEISAFNTGVVNLTGGERPDQLRSGRVSVDYFRLFGAPVVRGRTFSEREDLPGGGKVAMISHGLMSAFGAAALLLAAIGIYGLMAYAVAQRTQEIGIRLALGADAAAVKQMVIVQGMRLALVGVVIGLASAFGLTRFIASFLFGVTTLDPLVFVGIPVLLSAVALAAVWIPAGRASRVDPAFALPAQ